MSEVNATPNNANGDQNHLTAKGLLRRKQILDKAADLFDEVGYHAATIAMIADRAETTKANVYHYFNAKHDILCDIHDSWIEESLARFQQADQKYNDPRDLVHETFRDILYVIHTRRSQVRVYFEFFRELPEDLQIVASKKRDVYALKVQRVIERGMDQGVFVTKPAQIVTFGLFGLCNWTYQWYRPGGEFTHEQVADNLFDIFIGGLSVSTLSTPA